MVLRHALFIDVAMVSAFEIIHELDGSVRASIDLYDHWSPMGTINLSSTMTAGLRRLFVKARNATGRLLGG